MSLFGMYPSDYIRSLNVVDLKPCLSLYSTITSTKKVTKDMVSMF